MLKWSPRLSTRQSNFNEPCDVSHARRRITSALWVDLRSVKHAPRVQRPAKPPDQRKIKATGAAWWAVGNCNISLAGRERRWLLWSSRQQKCLTCRLLRRVKIECRHGMSVIMQTTSYLSKLLLRDWYIFELSLVLVIAGSFTISWNTLTKHEKN